MECPDPALEYFEEIVVPTVDEFMMDKSNKRRGVIAAMTLAAMVDHFFQARPEVKAEYKRVQHFLNSIWNKDKNGPPGPGKNFTISLLHDVANATKHVQRLDPKPGKAGRMSYQDIEATQLNVCGVMRCGWPLAGIEVVVGENREWLLSEVLECAMEFWRGKLGIIPEQKEPDI